MGMIQAPVRYFLGANTPSGFRDTVSDLYDPAQGWRVFLIKSGPGTGKSTLLKRIAMQTEEAEAFCCSSDPSSLDGVRLPQQKVLVLDATAPHAVEPRYWGACEQIVPLSVCADEAQLYGRREEICALTDRCRQLHAQARRCLAGAAQLLGDAFRLQRDALDEEKIGLLATHLAADEWTPREGDGREQRRWLSAVTPEGVTAFFATVQALCPRIYAIHDEEGAAAALLLRELRRLALAAGQRVTVCACPLFPDRRIEHILLPDSGTAFITANGFHPADFPLLRRIHATRFIDVDQWQQHRHKRQFDRRAAEELINGAAEAMAQAKAVHDQLEAISRDAMDWERVGRMGDELMERLYG